MSTTMTSICPACGSGKVVAVLGAAVGKTGLDAHKMACQDCPWEGTNKELLQVPLPERPNALDISPDQALELAREMSTNYMKLLYQIASTSVGACIMQAGFVGKNDTKSLTRMIRAACKGAHHATLEEADKISKELKKAGN
jgi:hypothetical protein